MYSDHHCYIDWFVSYHGNPVLSCLQVQVAIKCLAKDKMHTAMVDFLKEASIMHTIDHDHIVRLYGVVLESDALMLVSLE